MTVTVAPRNAALQRWWNVPFEFAVHTVVGALIFIVIALGAVAVGLVLQALEAAHINEVIILGLRVAEYAIFGADLLMFLVFIWRTTFRTLKRL